MHGNVFEPYIPIYGNKVIGIRHGVLDMHGAPVDPVWTFLEKTANKWQRDITLSRSVNWELGSEIVIAPTDYSHYQTEKRKIISIDRRNPDKPVLKLDK
jgi:hypothetical protein